MSDSFKTRPDCKTAPKEEPISLPIQEKKTVLLPSPEETKTPPKDREERKERPRRERSKRNPYVRPIVVLVLAVLFFSFSRFLFGKHGWGEVVGLFVWIVLVDLLHLYTLWKDHDAQQRSRAFRVLLWLSGIVNFFLALNYHPYYDAFFLEFHGLSLLYGIWLALFNLYRKEFSRSADFLLLVAALALGLMLYFVTVYTPRLSEAARQHVYGALGGGFIFFILVAVILKEPNYCGLPAFFNLTFIPVYNFIYSLYSGTATAAIWTTAYSFALALILIWMAFKQRFSVGRKIIYIAMAPITLIPFLLLIFLTPVA